MGRVIFNNNKYTEAVRASKSGFIKSIDGRKIGELLLELGAGRKYKDDNIDLYTGLYLKVKIGDYVEEGETIGRLYGSSREKLEQANRKLTEIIEITKEKKEKEKLIYFLLDENGVKKY